MVEDSIERKVWVTMSGSISVVAARRVRLSTVAYGKNGNKSVRCCCSVSSTVEYSKVRKVRCCCSKSSTVKYSRVQQSTVEYSRVQQITESTVLL
jgi:hypothetical protein